MAAAVGALAAITVMLAACNSTSSTTGKSSTTPSGPTSSAAAAAPINVVASTNVWGDIAKQIGGDHVNVTSIMSDPNADPHQYEADAKTAAALSKAQFVIENGLGYDDFTDKLLAASPNPGRVVLNAADGMKISGKDANPHIWYDVAKLPDVATGIADQLGKMDSADAATFTPTPRRSPTASRRSTRRSPTSRPSTRALRSATPNACRAIWWRRPV
jgi:zinc/manganese transport system substrate-binding protein